MTSLAPQVFPESSIQGSAHSQCLHLVVNFRTTEKERLSDPTPFRSFIDLLIEEFQLSKVGEIYHNIENGGFTGFVSLTGSHMSIHTWPDRHFVTFDVMLSSRFSDKTVTLQAIYKSVKTFFGATTVYEQLLTR